MSRKARCDYYGNRLYLFLHSLLIKQKYASFSLESHKKIFLFPVTWKYEKWYARAIFILSFAVYKVKSSPLTLFWLDFFMYVK